MSPSRLLVRALASAGAVVLVGAIAVAAAQPPPAADDTVAGPAPVEPWDGVETVADEEPVPEGTAPSGEEPADDEPAPDAAEPGTAGPGTIIETAPGFSITLRTPETSAQVRSVIAAYRAARGLSDGGSPPSWICTWGPGGSVMAGSVPPSESLGAAIIRTMPAAAGYQGPPGSVTELIITVHSFVDGSGVEHPGQGANILTKHCVPPPSPSPSPSVPSPPPPPPPSEPHVEPSAPPTEPDPTPSP